MGSSRCWLQTWIRARQLTRRWKTCFPSSSSSSSFFVFPFVFQTVSFPFFHSIIKLYFSSVLTHRSSPGGIRAVRNATAAASGSRLAPSASWGVRYENVSLFGAPNRTLTFGATAASLQWSYRLVRLVFLKSRSRVSSVFPTWSRSISGMKRAADCANRSSSRHTRPKFDAEFVEIDVCLVLETRVSVSCPVRG